MEGLEEVLECLHWSRVVAHHALLAILQSIFDISTMRMMIDTYMAMMMVHIVMVIHYELGQGDKARRRHR